MDAILAVALLFGQVRGYEAPPQIPQEVVELMSKGYFQTPKIKYTPTPIKNEMMSDWEREWVYRQPLPALPVPYPPQPYLPGANYVPQDVIQSRQQQKRPLQNLKLPIPLKGLLRRR